MEFDQSEDVFFLDRCSFWWFASASYCLERASDVVGDTALGDKLVECLQLHSRFYPSSVHSQFVRQSQLGMRSLLSCCPRIVLISCQPCLVRDPRSPFTRCSHFQPVPWFFGDRRRGIVVFWMRKGNVSFLWLGCMKCKYMNAYIVSVDGMQIYATFIDSKAWWCNDLGSKVRYTYSDAIIVCTSIG